MVKLDNSKRKSLRKIGILGGTFDPVHYGHLRIGLECKEALQLDELRMIPCAIPSHRDTPHADAEQRVAMTDAALCDVDDVFVDDRELKREGYSYTVDTLTSLKTEFPDAALYLILGSDSFQDILQWHKWQEIVDLSNIVIAQRPDHGNDHESQAGMRLANRFCSSDEVQKSLAGKITFVGVSQLEISATQIRKLVRENKSIKYLLPDSVINLISQYELYKK